MQRTTVPFTLRSAAQASDLGPRLTESALIIVDAQTEYLPVGALHLDGIEAAIGRLERLLRAARSAAVPLVHIVHQGRSGGLFDPEDGGRIIDQLGPTGNEKVITKSLPNAFAGTSLSDHLATLGNPPLFLAGFMTHMCISSTARAAIDLGLATGIVADATATRDLPAAQGTGAVPAAQVQAAALAALADRFSTITDVDQLID